MKMESTRQSTILLVEDQAIIALATADLLERNGYTVLTARTSDQACAIALQGCDLILMDIDLGPGSRDGIATAASILEHTALPIVFLTNHTEQELVERVEEVTRYGYVLKSAGEFILLQVIKLALRLFSAHQQSQDALERYKWLAENSSDGVSLFQDESITYISPSMEQLLGYAPEETIGASLEKLISRIHPDDSPAIQNAISEAHARQRTNFDYQYRVRRKGGEYIWIEDHVQAFYHPDGTHSHSFVSSRDIRERKQLELELKETIANLELAQRMTKIGSWRFDPDIGIPEWSDEIFRIYERDPADGPPNIGEYQVMYDPEQFKLFSDAFGAAVHEGIPYDIHLKFRTQRGTIKHIRAMGEPIRQKRTGTYIVQGVIQDITSTVENEERLQETLTLQETLLHEVNHRTKNNLLMISSLLRMQLKNHTSASPELEKVIHQVETIGLSYNKLSSSNSIEQVDLASYLGSVLQNLFGFAQNRVDIRISIPSFPVKIDTAIALGLIINEMGTNALKHAFPGSSAPVFGITLDQNLQDYTLQIYNSGRTFPEGFDLAQAKTKGLQLIKALSQQIMGTLSLDTRSGTIYNLNIPKA